MNEWDKTGNDLKELREEKQLVTPNGVNKQNKEYNDNDNH